MSPVDLFLYWVLPIVGIVYVIGYSALFEPLRQAERLPGFLKILLDCPMCIGFWVGLFVGFMNWIPYNWPSWLQLPVLGAVSAIGLQYLLELFGRSRQ